MCLMRLSIALLLLSSGCTTEAELMREGLLPTPDAGVLTVGAKLPKTSGAQAIIDDVRQKFQVEPTPEVAKILDYPPRRSVLPPSRVSNATVDAQGKIAVDFSETGNRSATVSLAENGADGFDVARESDNFAIKVKLQGAKTAFAEEAGGYVVYRNAHSSASSIIHVPTPVTRRG